MKIFVLSPQSTPTSERSKRPGDNALFVILKELRKLGCQVVGNEVALLPEGKPLPLPRRAKAIERHQMSNVTIIMGSDTTRNIKSWFPISEGIQVAQPFFFINDPGRIEIELFAKIKENYKPDNEIFGFDPITGNIGGIIG